MLVFRIEQKTIIHMQSFYNDHVSIRNLCRELSLSLLAQYK